MERIEIEFEGGKIVKNEEIGRVQIIFDEKPNWVTQARLKINGFRWSPREGAWQAPLTLCNLIFAQCILLQA